MKVGLALAFLLIGLVRGGEHLVVIDAGHGGSANSGTEKDRTLSSSNNATSPAGLKEKDLTLELSLEIRKQIQELARTRKDVKLECAMTRTEDKNPDFGKRAAFCASQGRTPSAIVAIHFNASAGHNATGTLAMVRQKGKNPNYGTDSEFATGLTKATSAAVSKFVPGSKPCGTITDSHLHGGIGSNFFHQLGGYPKLQAVPKCFLEVEFIDRADVDEKLLKKRKEAFPQIARAIAVYLYDYCAAR